MSQSLEMALPAQPQADRHQPHGDATGWAGPVFDAIDYGIAVLAGDARLVYANAELRRMLLQAELLRMDSAGCLRASDPRDEARLAEALRLACQGKRRLLQIGQGNGRPVLSLVGLGPANEGGGAQRCLLLCSRRQMCEPLAMLLFAQMHGLTPAEASVLHLLIAGLQPSLIATQQGVRISTVRTHISKLLEKSGSRSLRGLLRDLSMLPPVASALRHG